MGLRVSLAIAAAIVFAGSSADMAAKGLRYDATRPLTTLHGPASQNSLSDLDQILDNLASDDGPGKKLPILVYVHGRGNEPKKSFGDTMFTSGFMLRKLEQQGVRVLGFNWPSKIGIGQLCDRPVAEAKEAARGFTVLLGKLEVHRSQHPEFWQGRKLVLVAHSMGNILVAQALSDSETAQLSSSLFDGVVLSAADALLEGHESWLDNLQYGKAYVLSNPNDRFLRRSMGCEGKKAGLRLGLSHVQDDKVNRGSGTTYIEVPAGDRHRYISRGGQEGNPNTCTVVSELLRGGRPAFPSAWVVGANPTRVKIPKAVNRADPCFFGQGKDDKESDKES